MKSYFPAAATTSSPLQTFSVLKIVYGLSASLQKVCEQDLQVTPMRSILEVSFACLPEQERFFNTEA